MKVFNLLESDHFVRQEQDINLDYLFRVQAMRSLEFKSFLEWLEQKLPSWQLDKRSLDSLQFFHTSNINIGNKRVTHFTPLCHFPSQKLLPATKQRFKIKEMFSDKYKRMMKAKGDFESVGGKYNNYREG